MALDAIGVAPQRAMFVGDSVESDFGGGNRVGMRTVLITVREFAIGDESNNDPLTHPDHRANHLVEVLDLLGLTRALRERRVNASDGPGTSR